jgi:hypothetical protein
MVNKRGRKRKSEPYFGVDQESAVVVFLTSDDEERRNKVFNEFLKAPLDKMAESIIRKYKLYVKGETFEETHQDAISFLMTKFSKFDPSKGKKAYSYFGTICKHYVLGRVQKDAILLKRVVSYEDVSSDLESNKNLSYEMVEEFSTTELLIQLVKEIKVEMDDSNHSPKKKLTENERRVGESLIEMLSNWETFFNTMEGGPKYNKNSILETMRNYTNISTKDIRLSMKRFKTLYALVKYKDDL